ncbi:MAG: hypothetical protein WC467_03230 [Patescibacteria group bacterium]
MTIFCCRTYFAAANQGSNSGSMTERILSREQSQTRLSEQDNLDGGVPCLSSEIIVDDKPQIFSSFFDSFASDYLLNSAASTLYRDDLAAAVYFPPRYTWEEESSGQSLKNEAELAKSNSLAQNKISDFLEPLVISDRRCLGGNCLEQTGKHLSYQGKPLALPGEIKAADVVALTIGALDTRWLLGLTLKEGDAYQGRVYIFDGNKFSPLIFGDQTEKISSPYLGQFGFGGSDTDYLVIYGAYRGEAYRFQAATVTDISTFFDFRVMATGFRPEIIKATNGRVVNWYIYSSSLGRPRLIKLWQNSDGKISGEADYQNIFSNSGESASFRLVAAAADKFVLLATIRQDNMETNRVFTDRGFESRMPGELIYNAIIAEPGITIKKLAASKLGSPDNPCSEGKLSFSTDNNFWQELPSGQNLNQTFKATVENNYFLRVDFPAQTDSFYSPFLNEVLFDFYYQK